MAKTKGTRKPRARAWPPGPSLPNQALQAVADGVEKQILADLDPAIRADLAGTNRYEDVGTPKSAPDLAATPPQPDPAPWIPGELNISALPLEKLSLGRNLRAPAEDEDFIELSESIRKNGILQPILVRPWAEGKYQVICGHRRTHAAIRLGLRVVPVHVAVIDDGDVEIVQYAENTIRVGLAPMQEAEAIQAMLAHGWHLGKVAATTGKSRRYLQDRMLLLRLAPKIQNEIRSGAAARKQVSLETLAAMAELPEEEQEQIYHRDLRTGDPSAWIQERVARNRRKLSAAPWDLDDVSLFLEAGSCTACPATNLREPSLFALDAPPTDAQIRKEGRCLLAECWEEKRTRFVARKIREAKEKLGRDPVVVAGPGAMGTKAPGCLNEWEYDRSAKDKKGARPAVVVDGQGIGNIVYVVPHAAAAAKIEKKPATAKEKERAKHERAARKKDREFVDQVYEMVTKLTTDKNYVPLHPALMILAAAFGLEPVGSRAIPALYRRAGGEAAGVLWQALQSRLLRVTRRSGSSGSIPDERFQAEFVAKELALEVGAGFEKAGKAKA